MRLWSESSSKRIGRESKATQGYLPFLAILREDCAAVKH